MNRDILEKNKVEITGKIATSFVYNHEVFGEKFYTADVIVKRLSGFEDMIPLVVSERLVDVTQSYVGQMVHITGQFRSFNKHEATKNRLILNVFVLEWKFVENIPCGGQGNEILLDGYVCKIPTYRKTPLGREITDLLIAVNRPYGKSDYIPCICWGRNSRYVSDLPAGTHIRLRGRVQSRAYKKIIDETRGELRIAYEVSVSGIEIVEDKKDAD